MTMMSAIGTETEAHDSDLKRLEQAVGEGDLETVKSLTKAGSSDLAQAHPDLFTSLAQIACEEGHLKVLQYLVEDLSVDINWVTTAGANGCRSMPMPLGSSLLQISIAHDYIREHYEGKVFIGYTSKTFNCIEWLTRRGANAHQKNSEGEDAFATARRAEHLQALGCLSWSLLDNCSEDLKYGRFPSMQISGTGLSAYEVIRSSRDFLEILGLVWYVQAQSYPITDRNFSQLSDLLKTLRPQITQNVCEEKSASDYRWIGEPICTFPRGGCVSTWIIKIPLFTYIPQGKHKSRWTDAFKARTTSGIGGTTTKAGLEVVSTFDEYCYPDLSEEALKERNGDQVVCKNIQRLAGKPSDDSPMLAISQACIWRFQTEDNKDSIFVSVIDIPKSDTHDRKYSWGLLDRVAIRTAEEFIGVLLSKMLVEYDILLQDDHTFDVPRVTTIFARSIARVQQDVNEYMQALSDIKIVKEKSFLHDIEDIREEISMIQTVLIHQETTWREFAYKSWPTSWKHGYEGQFEPEWENDWKQQDREKWYPSGVKYADVENKWRVIQRPQEHFRKLRTQLDKLDRDAERVQRSIELKLDLKQRHASLKEARTASLMGASVFGFTIITIIFTPLSFMTGLFALPIDRLEVAQSTAPDSSSGGSGQYSTGYIAKWMATTELVSLAVTIFCVWVALKHFTQGDNGQNQLGWLFDQAERARGKDTSETAKTYEDAAGSGNTSSMQREDISQYAVWEKGRVESKRSVRKWAISMLERLVNFLKDAKERSSPV